jgi:peptidoglycan/LPS O-acetylase OafA/YrhL
VSSGSPKVSERIPSLDGLRAVSILLVLVSHSTLSMPPALADHPHFWLFAANSQLGVRTFFVISGLLITSLLVRDFDEHGGVRIAAFYGRRVRRIFPAFYTYILVLALLVALHVVRSPATSDFVTAATFTWNYGHIWYPGNFEGRFLLGQFWTLAVEEQFYLLWPVTLAMAGLVRARTIAVILLAAMPLVRVAAYFLWPAARAASAELLQSTADCLMVGVIIALSAGTPRFEALVARLTRTPWPSLAAVVVATVVSPLLKSMFGGPYLLAAGWTIDSLCIGLVVLYLTRLPGCTAGRILNSRPFVAIGVLSYSLYLWSMLFFSGVNRTWTGTFPVGYVMTVLAATLSYHLVEKPILRMGRGAKVPTNGATPAHTFRAAG